jgi:site-specific recombinase XerD
MTAFRVTSRAAGRRKVLGPQALAPLLSYLRQAGATPPLRPLSTPLEVLLSQFRSWLLQERGLAATTVLRYENTARRFLGLHAMVDGCPQPAALTGVDVNTFLLHECGRVSAGSAKGRVAELRSILRFLFLQGLTPMQLGSAVPPVGGWRLAALPPTMTAADVQRLLDGCDRQTAIGYLFRYLLIRLQPVAA